MHPESSTPFEVEVLTRLGRMEEKIDGGAERVADIEHDLYGNGQPGIAKRLTVVETVVDERTDPKKVAGISSILTALITVLGALLAREAGV